MADRKPCRNCGGPKEAGKRRQLCDACIVLREAAGGVICAADGCERPVGDKGARGLCLTHYSSWRRTGSPPAEPLRYRRWAAKERPHCTVVLPSGEACPYPHEGNGYCTQHNWRFKRHGDPQADRPIRTWREGCEIPDCKGQHYARGLCMRHYGLWRAHGDPTKQVGASPGQADFYDQGYHLIHVDGRIVREHRHVMEQQLGRRLLPDENVHHRNGDRADNRPENLELWVTRQPKGQRALDLLEWAEEIVARYGPERDKL